MTIQETMNVHIEPDKKGLWIIIDKTDDCKGLAWAVLPEEIEPIMNACKKYLEEHETN